MSNVTPHSDADTATDYKTKFSEPNLYKVIIHNDDVTPFIFVISLLMNIFQKDMEEASEITMEVHTHDRGIAGVYTYEIAETKVEESTTAAQMQGFPLRLTMEEDG